MTAGNAETVLDTSELSREATQREVLAAVSRQRTTEVPPATAQNEPIPAAVPEPTNVPQAPQRQREQHFDPVAEAQKQRAGEARRAQIEDAYEKMYGAAEQTKSAFDVTLEIAQKMRGTLGGTFGTLLGAALDIAAIFQEQRKKRAEVAERQDLIKFKLPEQPTQPKIEVPKPPVPTAEAPHAPNVPLPPTAPSTAPPLPTVTPAPPGDTSTSVAVTEKPPPVVKPVPAVPEATAAPEAAAAAGGAEAMAAAAGPVAIVMAVMEAVKGLRDGAMAATRGLGNLAVMAASPDANPAMMVQNIGEGTKAVSDKLLYVNPALSVFGSVIGEATTQVGRFMDAVNQRANQLAEFSPQIAQAQALAEVQQTMGELRRAQEAGPELARYIQMQGDLQHKFEDIKIKVLIKILPIVTAIGTAVEKAMAAGDDIASVLTKIALPMELLATLMARWLNMQENERDIDPTSLVLQNPGPLDRNVPPV